MTQQFRESVTLLADIRFKRKDGTHKTLSKVLSELNGIVPMEVIGAVEPVGRLTMGVESEVMWSVAPLSKIQGLVNIEFTEGTETENKPGVFA